MKHLFLVSLPRSGSTVVQAVLSNHSAIATTPEPWVQLFAQAFHRPDLVRARFNWEWAETALSACMERDPREIMREKIGEFAEDFYSANSDAREHSYFLDKTPRYYFILNELFETFPNAKFLVVSRSLASVYASIHKTWIPSESPNRLDQYLFDLLEGPRHLTDFLESHGGSERVLATSYEEVVQGPERIFKEIFEWLGLSYGSELLNYGPNQTFKGGFGDPTGVYGNTTITPRALPEGQSFRDSFPNRETAGIASGLVAFAQREGFVDPFPEQWEPGRDTEVFQRILRRYRILSRAGMPAVKDSLLYSRDEILKRLLRRKY